MKNMRFDLIQSHPMQIIPEKVPDEMRYVTVLKRQEMYREARITDQASVKTSEMQVDSLHKSLFPCVLRYADVTPAD